MTALVPTPSFVAPYSPPTVGLDFLGMRAVNLGHVVELMPGITNVTTRLRPYSLMAWMAWSFARACREQGVVTFDRRTFRAYQEKVEVAYTWSHALFGKAEGVGATQATSESSGSGLMILSFAAWRRNQSWLDPANYGPSIRTGNGLGFLTEIESGVFAVTARGAELAEALDASLRRCAGYSQLCQLTDHRLTHEDARSLYPGWQIDTPSTREQDLFRSAFWNRAEPTNSSCGRRTATIDFFLCAIFSGCEPVSEVDIRNHLFFGEPSIFQLQGNANTNRETKGRWCVLQVRQAQRLALEALLRWIEIEVIERGRGYTGDMVNAFVNSNETTSPAWVSEALDEIEAAGPLFLPKKNGTKVDLLAKVRELEALRGSDSTEQLALCALQILLLCVVCTQQLKDDPAAKPFLADGGAQRISLSHWQRFVTANRSLPLNLFVLRLIENFVLSQHFGIAAARYIEGQQRLRLTIEDSGLVALVANPLWPAITPDRVFACLSLMTECSMISVSGQTGSIMYSTIDMPGYVYRNQDNLSMGRTIV